MLDEAKEVVKEIYRDSQQELYVEFSGTVNEIYEKAGIEGVILGRMDVAKKINPDRRLFPPREHMVIGQEDEALEALELAVASRAGGTVYFLIKFDPLFKPLHDHPRFVALLRKMNLNQ